MDTGALQDILAALNIWSGHALVTWASELTTTLQAALEPYVTSTTILGAHTTVASALTHWGAAAAAAGGVTIRVLPHLLGDR